MDIFLNSSKRVVASVKMCRLHLILLILIFQTGSIKAQIAYSESFDITAPSQTLPFGWAQGRQVGGTDIDNLWDRVNTGTLPACTPRSGAAMLRYQSRIITAGEASYLVSKRMDMRTIPAGGSSFSFWMYRDGGYPVSTDKLNIYLNSTPDLSGSPQLLLETGSTSNVLNRYCGMNPSVVATCNAWNQYSYTIPATWNTTTVYIIIVATSGFGNNIYLDDFSVTSYPKTANQSLVTSSPAVINQNSSLIAKNTINQHIIGVRITMDGNYVPRILSNMEFNTNGCTNPVSDITNAKLWFTGGTPVFDPANAQLLGTVSQPWLTNYMFLTSPAGGYSGLASINTLDHGDNFFWITYDIVPGAVTDHVVDAEWIAFKLTGISYTPGVYTLTGNRKIQSVYCTPTYSIGTSWQNYTNNDYINNVQLAGNLALGINNNQNIINSYAGPLCPFSYPANCPFQTHPTDFELMPQVSGKTTALTANGVTTYSLSLQVGSYGSGNAIAAWIDFNMNSVFEPSEKIAQSGLMGPLGIYTTNFSVPLAAAVGETRMRVREVWLDTNIDPCNHRFFGETEDYMVTIIRDCNGPAGWTTWLGYSDEWSDPSNWCPTGNAPVNGIPTDVNVIIPGGPSFAGYTYYKPVIKSGVLARAAKLRIQNADTLFINASVPGSLTVLDSLSIQNTSSALVVKTTYQDTIQITNGLLNRPADSPLKSFERARSLLLITQPELTAMGLKTNDVITNLLIHMQRMSNGNAYKNFTIKMYYTTAGFNFTSGFAGIMPAPVGAAQQTVFSGDLSPASFIPAPSGTGTINILLASPFIWNGSGNQVVIEMCYDNTGFPLTGTNDELRFTQTTSFRKYMTLENLTAYPKAGCDILPSDYFTATASGNAGTNTVTVNAAAVPLIFAGAKVVGSGPFNGSITATVTGISGNVVTLNSNVLSTFTNGTITFYNTNSIAINYRPNVSFRFTRPFGKYPIYAGGNWQNNGSFIPGTSMVVMNGSALQHIDGSASTTFYDLKIQNPYHVKRMKDFVVTDSLQLAFGILKLNNGLVTLTNPAPSALTYVMNAGDIQADADAPAANVAPYGRITWNMGAATGTRTIPFISADGIRIPLTYTIDNGNHDITFGTYATLPDNLNWPLPDVTNILGMNNGAGGIWGASGWGMVDRYYMVQNAASGTAQADITFRYTPSEQAQSGNIDMRAQRWVNSGNLWEFPFQPNQAFTAGNPNMVQVPDFTGFASGNWWTIVGDQTPLPVSLLDFTAEKKQNKVKLSWSTASEINNSHFDVERTVNNDDFKLIDRVASAGPGNNYRYYETWDNAPIEGLQYYYLRQYDYDGRMASYGPVAVNFKNDLFEILSTYSSPLQEGLSVLFQYNSTEPYSYKIMDMAGRNISAMDNNDAKEGINVINIKVDLSHGAYYILLWNKSNVVTRKFFY